MLTISLLATLLLAYLQGRAAITAQVNQVPTGKDYKLCSSLLYNSLQLPVTSSLLGPNILLSNLFSVTLSSCSSLKVRVSFTPKQTDRPTYMRFKFLTVVNEECI
jgi:hypothetical protein